MPVVEFAVHAIVGTAIFSFVAFPAIAIDWAVGQLLTRSVGIRVGLTIAEYSLFGTDIVLFIRFLYVSGRRAWDKF